MSYPCECVSSSAMSDSAASWTAAHQAPLYMGILQARILEWVAMPSSRGSSDPGIKPRCQLFKHMSHQGSPRILEWVAYPFFRQRPDSRINWDLLHRRRIHYQLSYQGSPESGHQFSSVTQPRLTLCDPMDCSTLNFILSFKT